MSTGGTGARRVATRLVAIVAVTVSLLALTAGPARACTTDYLAGLQQVRADLDASPAPGSADDIQRLKEIARSQNASGAIDPVVADLEAGEVASAKRRLDGIIGTLALPAGSVCNADLGGARDTLHRVYQSPVFADLDKAANSGPSWLENIVTAILRFLSGLTGALGPALSILIAAVVLGGLAGLALWRLRQVSAGGRRASVSEPAAESGDPDTEWRLALEAAGRGDHREAIRRAFRSALLSVAVRGRMPVSTAWTTRELLAEAGRDPDLLALLAPAAAIFDLAWYSGEPVEVGAWEQGRSRCQAIRELAERRPMAA